MSRESVIATASKYLEGGLIGREPETVPFAADCFSIENGWDTSMNREELHERLHLVPNYSGYKNARWLVEGDDAVVTFDLVHTGNKWSGVTEYFRISAGLIHEMRPTFPATKPPRAAVVKGPSLRPVLPAPRESGWGHRAELIRLCSRYLDALVQHDFSPVPLGKDITFIDNDVVTAHGKDESYEWARAGFPRFIKGLLVKKWIVEGDEVMALLNLELSEGSPHWSSQYFRTYNGLIKEVQANHGLAPTQAEIEAFRNGPGRDRLR